MQYSQDRLEEMERERVAGGRMITVLAFILLIGVVALAVKLF